MTRRETLHFVTVVEVKLKECGTAGREVRAKAYVTRAGDGEVILGTNVLPQSGFQLVRVTGDDKANETRDKVAQKQFDDGRRLPTVATVALRSYIAPGTVQWITLRGIHEGKIEKRRERSKQQRKHRSERRSLHRGKPTCSGLEAGPSGTVLSPRNRRVGMGWEPVRFVIPRVLGVICSNRAPWRQWVRYGSSRMK
ncbi:unnamed protein product [Nippostrongylus brasiliensis]|uniref:Transthyretin-like family protein n=1 Tax=Nippostrongylus brasiliensis TaxID=27835 RepID=A0A0N4YL70_NIPBR|nr:unnamed protein product [Nippostrongylus brasiliensis]